ncbi:MAG: SO_0444 family Cu/Zn efflux transporter [Saprospiraceae bacterium]|nr:SO_0444 family Cu/Zn efflux transporter [Saprospiraceae bacterium]
MEFTLNFFQELVTLTNEMSPYLLLGFLIAGILHIYIKKEKITKYLGKKNIKTVIVASIFGIPLPLCSCGVIPTGISFYKDGASKGATVSFLISTPQTGMDSIMITYSLLGLPFAIIRPIVALISGVIGGILTNNFDKKEIEKPADLECTNDNPAEHNQNKLKLMFKYAFVEFMQDIAKWLIIGLLVAALIAVLIPDNFFEMYIGNNYLSMLMILVVSIPLYVCATGSVPIVAVLLMKGLSPGAALVFLMAGPATNAATITVIGKSLGQKTLILYLISIISGALIFGIFIDSFLPISWFQNHIINLAHGHESHLLPYWLKVSSSIILTILLINGIFRKYFMKNKSKTDMTETIITVKGMTCNHCKANVEKSLLKLEGIKEVVVDLASSKVRISGEKINLLKVKTTLDEIGYELVD